MTRSFFFGFLLATTFCFSANAEMERTIDTSRIHLMDVSDGYDEGDLAMLDLGPAPPPGSSRLLSRGEVEEELHAAGDDGKSLRMPTVLRVKSASRRWSAAELNAALEPKLAAGLPFGVTLKSSRLTRSIVTSPSATLGNARFPKFPKHEGELTVTAMVDIVQDDVTVLRFPVNVVVLVTEAATRPAAGKGARVTLVIEHGPARVTALATAMSDTELGESALFRVSSTQRVLHARLVTSDTAMVVQ